MANSINSVSTQGQIRQPLTIVNVNGTSVPGWIEWEINNNSHRQADTFRVVFAVSQLPPQYGIGWWAAQPSVSVEIFAGFPADPVNYTQNQLMSLIYGNVDDLNIDPVEATVTVSGRDQTALFIDTKTTELFKEKLSSEIAALLAARHGLLTTITPTKINAGTLYQLDANHLHDQHSEWDLLCFLADKEEYVVSVNGQVLNFVPKPDPTQATPYILQWEPGNINRAAPAFNGKSLTLSRSLTVAKGVSVTVISHNTRNGIALGGKPITSTYPKAAVISKAGTAGVGTLNYTFYPYNLDQQHADEYAQNKHREITRHEMKFTATLPGDNLLLSNSVVQITGTGTEFDQNYFVDSVRRSMNAEEGYVMTVTGRNHNIDIETAA